MFPGCGTGSGYGQGEFVDGHAVSDGQSVDTLVGRLSGEDLPQQDAVAPHVRRFGERRRLDDFGRHPRVGAGGGHARRLVRLARQTKVGDLQRLELQVLVLDRFGNQHWPIDSNTIGSKTENTPNIGSVVSIPLEDLRSRWINDMGAPLCK